MTTKDFSQAVALIQADSGDLTPLSMQAEHDQIWIGDTIDPPSDQGFIQALEDLGVFYDEDNECWSCYV
jgi:hypothetical protein